MLTLRDEMIHIRSVARYLNVTEWSVRRINGTQPFEEKAEWELERVRRREVDIALTVSPLTYEMLSESSQSLPVYYLYGRLLSWKYDGPAIGRSGLFRMFDVWCWTAIVIYVIVQVVVYWCAFSRGASHAFCSVCAVFLRQPIVQQQPFTWKLNALFLYVAAFSFGRECLYVTAVRAAARKSGANLQS
jgi:hypothetical protein